MNNNRQLALALHLYALDSQDYMPWPNWGNADRSLFSFALPGRHHGLISP